MSRKLTLSEFIEKAKFVHGDKYDYSKSVYENTMKKIMIICPIHGEFMQTPNSHLQGQGCPECKKDRLSSLFSGNRESFIEKSIKKHGKKYDYSKVSYINNHTEVCITCPIHGDFMQTPNHHLDGKGCPKCGLERRVKNSTNTIDEFISRA